MVDLKFYSVKEDRLKYYIKHYWIAEGKNSDSKKSKLLPMGHVDLIINLGDYFRYDIDYNHTLDSIHFHGVRDSHMYVEEGKNIWTIGISFTPWGFYHLYRAPMSNLRNKIISTKPISDLFKGLLINHRAYTNNYMISSIENILLKTLYSNSIDKENCNIIKDFLTHSCSVKDYCTQHNINQRKLERIFSKYIGTSPKQYKKVMKFESITTEIIFQNKAISLTDITYSFNYYDQSHFNKNFKESIGDTPLKFIEKKESTKLNFKYL